MADTPIYDVLMKQYNPDKHCCMDWECGFVMSPDRQHCMCWVGKPLDLAGHCDGKGRMRVVEYFEPRTADDIHWKFSRTIEETP